MKQNGDEHSVEREFSVVDWVYLKMQPFRQNTIAKGRTHKLSPRYAGPFQVIERIGPVAYKLRLPVQAKIHNVFHVVLLKKKVGNESVVSELPSFF